MKNKGNAAVAMGCLILAASLTACGGSTSAINEGEMPKIEETATDIDLDSLNDAADKIGNLNLTGDTGNEEATADSFDESTKAPEGTTADQPEGDLTRYSFVDVYADGNDLTVVPNGGLTASTELYGGKDLEGLLDYVDDEVLEAGRTINRELFYDVLAIMLVDKDLGSDVSYIETNMMMALAFSNNFYNMDVRIEDCYLDAENAEEYRYHVTAEGKSDTWIVNYKQKTVYFNDGATEYTSDMFKDDYLAVWLTVIEQYYGIS